MATIHSRKKEPLSIEKMNEIFKGSFGVQVEEYRDGIARISNVSSPEHQWWIDARSLVGDEIVTIHEVSRRLNRQIPERRAFFGAHC